MASYDSNRVLLFTATLIAKFRPPSPEIFPVQTEQSAHAQTLHVLHQVEKEEHFELVFGLKVAIIHFIDDKASQIRDGKKAVNYTLSHLFAPEFMVWVATFTDFFLDC